MADSRILGGRYQLEVAIGDGGMARVYRARDIRLSRTVAVKVLRDQFSTEAHFIERFMQEARLAAGLAHPAIVGVYDVGSDEGLYYIVMEYVDGDTLRQLMAREAPMQLDAVLPIIRQLAEALDYAHSRGVVHRDIKPENILITDKGEVKVGDFGIARALASSSLTTTGTVLGSVSYFSPEQASGYPATPESDLYSLGIVLYEMLTRQLPFAGATPMATAMAHVNDQPPSLRAFRPDLPPPVEGVVLKAIAKNPPVRYHSGQDLINALQQAAQPGQRPGRRGASTAPFAATMVNPVVVGQPQRLQKPTRGNGGALAALLTTAALLVAAVLVAHGLTSGDQSASPPDPTQTATPQLVLSGSTATRLPGSVLVVSTSTPPVQQQVPLNTATAPVVGMTPVVVATVTPSAIFTATPDTVFVVPSATALHPITAPVATPVVSAETSPLSSPPAAHTNTPTVHPSATAQTAVLPGKLTVDLVTAKGVGPHYAPVNPSSTFSSSTTAIYAFAILHNKPKGQAIHFLWRYPNGKTFAYDNPYVAAYSDTTGYAELVPAGPGEYSVTISVGGKLIATTTFTVVPGKSGPSVTPTP